MKDLGAALRPLGLASARRDGGGGATESDPPDYSTDDGRLFVDVAASHGGTRDLRASVVQLALRAQGRPDGRGALLILRTRMSAAGLRAEWRRLLEVLAPGVAGRLGLVALLDDGAVVLPDEAALREIATAAGRVETAARRVRVDRSFEVMRVLMARWLMRRGRIAIGELGRQAGLSHPSVAKALAALGDAVERKPDRSAMLRAIPHEQWARLLALAPRVRQTTAFAAAPGRVVEPGWLLERLADLRPTAVAVGGVVAARYWHPGLELPPAQRVDLSVHAPNGPMDTAFVGALELGLVSAQGGTPPLLVLHAVPRAESLFTPRDGIPIADPVEVMLDLCEIGRNDQAGTLQSGLVQVRGRIAETASTRRR
ncbi:MAG: hypothetical protein H6736_21160 [Alphaproteobacteria bacterium]|nr:hypothetical protein [Alphaproteobacteria bacterium]